MENGRKVIFSALGSFSTNTILKNYCDLLKSHSERYKFIINSCNNKLLSYHHLTTLNHVEFNHPICQFITYLMKEMPYSGLYCGILISSYLSKLQEILQQTQQASVSFVDIITRLNKTKEIVLIYLDKMKKKQDLSGQTLMSIVKATLSSVDKVFASVLAANVVKASIFAADDCSSKLGHIIIKAVHGPDTSETYNGILHKQESLWVAEKGTMPKQSHRVLLFIESLDIASYCAQSEISVGEFIAGIVAANVKVIACQKSIDKKIIHLLCRHNIFAVERLGEECANALAHLSGAFPISHHCHMNLEKLLILVGVIANLRTISINKEDYLLMESDSHRIVTLFISHRSFDTLDQLKAVVKEGIHAMHSVFKCPYFLPDSFDKNLIIYLRNYEDSDFLLKKIMTLFAESLEDTSPTKGRTELLAPSHRDDIYILKRNSLIQAFQTIANMLQVGLFVAKN